MISSQLLYLISCPKVARDEKLKNNMTKRTVTVLCNPRRYWLGVKPSACMPVLCLCSWGLSEGAQLFPHLGSWNQKRPEPGRGLSWYVHHQR
jgi:hypothetical protein